MKTFENLTAYFNPSLVNMLAAALHGHISYLAFIIFCYLQTISLKIIIKKKKRVRFFQEHVLR